MEVVNLVVKTLENCCTLNFKQSGKTSERIGRYRIKISRKIRTLLEQNCRISGVCKPLTNKLEPLRTLRVVHKV